MFTGLVSERAIVTSGFPACLSTPPTLSLGQEVSV